MRPYIWCYMGRFFVSPRHSLYGLVLKFKTYPGTREDGYPSLAEAMDAAVHALTTEPS